MTPPSGPDQQAALSGPERPPAPFRTTLIRVLIVQLVALALLGLLQAFYS